MCGGEDIVGPGGTWTAALAERPGLSPRALLKSQGILPGAGPRLSVPHPTAPPFGAIGLLNLFRNGSLVLVGSGFCLEPDVFVTAEHNLSSVAYDAAGIWMAYDWQANAGVLPQSIAAFATHAHRDLAVLILRNPQPATLAIGNPVAAGAPVQLAGYGYATQAGKARFTFGTGPVTSTDGQSLAYIVSTREGDSGAPVTAPQQGGQRVVGLHREGQPAGGHGNAGLVFTPQLVADLHVMIDWARQQVRN